MVAGSFDTIVAVSSPPGPAVRGIVRLSGERALALAETLLLPGEPGIVGRGAWSRRFQLFGFPVRGLLLVLPAPRSATGEDQAELHLPGSPVLLAEVVQRLIAAGARAAQPGEFTRRAFERGRLSLGEAQAVCDLIHARSEDAARRAAALLGAGLGKSLERVRADLVDALAWIEAGLDFEDDDTGAVPSSAWQPLLERAVAAARDLTTAPSGAWSTTAVVLSGDANAGKSTLFNALLGRERALVSPVAGTTRDVLREPLVVGDRSVLLCDLPGRRVPGESNSVDRDAIDQRAQVLAARQRDQAEILLHVHDGTQPLAPGDPDPRAAALVLTKADLQQATLAAAGVPVFRVSAHRGQGLDELRDWLGSQCGRPPGLLEERSAAACVRLVEVLTRALDLARGEAPPELAAVEVREALLVLEDAHGRTTDDDVLDRIFARFCLGK